jgi:hypothetical protein
LSFDVERIPRRGVSAPLPEKICVIAREMMFSSRFARLNNLIRIRNIADDLPNDMS